MITLADINAMTGADFIAAFGDVAEHSPWVAEAAWRKHPFVSREDLRLGRPLHRKDEGKAEARLVGVVERREAGEFVRRQPVEPGARLLAGRILGEPCFGGEIGMGADERQLRRLGRLVHRLFE